MFRKPIYSYLGDADATLTERANTRCGGSHVAYPAVVVGGGDNAAESAASRSIPRVAGLDENRGIVFYSTAAVNNLYYRVFQVDTDGVATWVGTEQTLVSGTLVSFDAVQIRDDKILLVYRTQAGGQDLFARVGTVDASHNMTFTGTTTLNNVMAMDTGRGWPELVQVSTGRAVVAAANTDNAKVSVQVIDVDASDVITFGTVGKSTYTNATTLKVAMLTPTQGVVSWAGVSVNVAATAVYFTISGTSITFHGTSYAFLNATQFPSATRLFYLGDLAPKSSGEIAMFGSSEVTPSGGSAVPAATPMQITNAAGVLTSTAATQDLDSSDYTSAPTSVKGSAVTRGSNYFFFYESKFNTPREVTLVQYAHGNPPTYVQHFLIEAHTLVTHPDSCLIGDNYGANVWYSGDTTGIKVDGMYFNPSTL